MRDDPSADASGIALIRVRDAWNGWRTAEVPVRDLHDLRWVRPAGAPHAILHALVSCSGSLTGTLPHACSGTSAPHQLQVCLLRTDVLGSLYVALAQRATRAMECASPRNGSHRLQESPGAAA